LIETRELVDLLGRKTEHLGRPRRTALRVPIGDDVRSHRGAAFAGSADRRNWMTFSRWSPLGQVETRYSGHSPRSSERKRSNSNPILTASIAVIP